jgi:hypothetical protein
MGYIRSTRADLTTLNNKTQKLNTDGDIALDINALANIGMANGKKLSYTTY